MYIVTFKSTEQEKMISLEDQLPLLEMKCITRIIILTFRDNLN